MIDAGFFRRFYIAASVLCVLLAVGAYVHWGSARIVGGVVAGFAVGTFPFVTWQLIGRLLHTRRGRVIAAGLTLMKYGFLAGALYLLLTRGWVHPWALMAGMLAVSGVFFLVAMLRLATAPSGEVA